MNLQTFLTLLVVGAVTGLVATLTGKAAKTQLPLSLIVAIAGAFIGWFIFTEVSRTALQVLFAIGGSLVLLWLVRVIKK
ncbi:MAG: hypothetical protein H7Y06_02990 [Opitutaceae bacterium]|nr:hypothetical protein [Opitutaceae bacterium]